MALPKGFKLSEETRNKMRLAHTGMKYSEEHRRRIGEGQLGNKRKPLTEEHKRKMSLGLKGLKRSEETKRRLSEALKGVNTWSKGSQGGFYGKTHSDEAKKKMSLKRKGIKRDEETKRKISEGLKGNKNPMFGKKHSEEYIQLMKDKRALMIFPKQDSSIEIKIQNFLKELGIEYFTHQYRNEIKHSYQCDVFIPSMNLVIECDGNYWHKYPVGTEIDHIRTSELLEKGFKVLRLWEKDIKFMDINKFKDLINGI